MATKRFRGDAVALAQNQYYTLAGTWVVGETITFTVGVKTAVVTITSTVIDTILAQLESEFNDLNPSVYPEFSGEIEASDVAATDRLYLAAKTAGVPFTIALSTNSAAGTISSVTVVQASKGPHHYDDDDNWDSNGVPGADDIDLSAATVDILYGLDQSAVRPASFKMPASASCKVGLKDWNDNGYYEYRTKSLTFQDINSGTGTADVGDGPGPGSSRVRLKVTHATNVTTFNLRGSAQPEQDGVKAIQLETGGANNVVNVTRGSIEIAGQGGQAATLATLRVGYQTNVEADADVRCGAGAVLTGCTIDKSGGQLETNSAVSSLTDRAGQSIHNAGALTTLAIRGTATVVYNSTGTLGTCTIGDQAKLDLSQDPRAKTITNPIECYSREAQVVDPQALLNNATPALIIDYNFQQVLINGAPIGTNVRITRSAVA